MEERRDSTPENACFQALSQLKWPDEFVVEYHDGQQERLLRGEGVSVMPPADDPENIGGFTGDAPPKHPRNQKRIGRFVRFSELRAIYDKQGKRLWP